VTGVVVVVVVDGASVVAVVPLVESDDPEVADEELPDESEEPEVVDVLGADVDAVPEEPGVVVVVPVVGVAEWAMVSDATSTPSPMAPAAAPTPTVVVTRRIRRMARSRSRWAERRSSSSSKLAWCTMVWPSASGRSGLAPPGRSVGISALR
jgi:hypothetical protein